MQERVLEHFTKLGKLPLATIATDSQETRLEWGDSFVKAISMLKSADTVRIIGNGGSAAIASHIAEDYTKTGHIRTVAFNDAAMLTCFANDMGYENVFSAAIDYYAEPSDLIIAISSSGKSPNILNGVSAARTKGCDVMTFSGFNPHNLLRTLGDLNFYVPDDSYGNVEICHLSLLHGILDIICENY